MTLRPIGSNQTELRIGNKIVLFSYQAPVALYDVREMKYFATSKKWSKATSKHINAWLTDHQATEKPQEFFDELVK